MVLFTRYPQARYRKGRAKNLPGFLMVQGPKPYQKAKQVRARESGRYPGTSLETGRCGVNAFPFGWLGDEENSDQRNSPIIRKYGPVHMIAVGRMSTRVTEGKRLCWNTDPKGIKTVWPGRFFFLKKWNFWPGLWLQQGYAVQRHRASSYAHTVVRAPRSG